MVEVVAPHSAGLLDERHYGGAEYIVAFGADLGEWTGKRTEFKKGDVCEYAVVIRMPTD